jgi:indole-3-glycerol phosphate synthase
VFDRQEWYMSTILQDFVIRKTISRFSVKTNLKEARCEEMDWIQLALDEVQRRDINRIFEISERYGISCLAEQP